MDFKLEICCASADDVFAASKAGAHRVELNSALFLGGLTPSLGTVREAKKAGIPIMAMIRPRDGGFCYTRLEFESMLRDVQILCEEGVDGVVFGVLTADGRVDTERCRILAEAAGDREKVFHRAFDVVPDWREAMDELIDIGFDRILTSGQSPNAILGAETIREMVTYSAGRIEILPGAGIRDWNINELLKLTGCTQAHASAGSKRRDSSCGANPHIHFGALADLPDNEYSATDAEKVRALLKAVKFSR